MTGINVEQPEYKLDEEDDFIKITVPAPLSRPNSAAVVLEGNVLTFDSPPYLLKLKLPSKVSDTYNDVAFDEQKNTYTIKLKKDKNANNEVEEEDEDEFACPEEKLLYYGRKKETEKVQHEIEDQFYGFGNLYSKMFGKYYSEFYEIIDLPDPDKTTPQKRTKLRMKDEIRKFNIDHYLGDFMEPDLDYPIENYYNYKPPWVTSPVKNKLRDDEMESLEELPKKDWLKLGLAEDVRKICELQMIDILFGYAYNKQITEGDDSVASAWNITKISSSLSWFETFKDVKEVVVTCCRRMITFPLCRNWKLADVVRNNVINILKLGPKQLTRCLLEIRDIFNETENYYVLNTLFINDLCHFGYNLNAKRTMELSEEVRTAKIERHEAYEDLPFIEYAAHMVAHENRVEIQNRDVKALTADFRKLKTKSTEMPSGSESDDEDCTTSDDSTEATESSYDGHHSEDEDNEIPSDENKEEEEDSASGEGEDDDEGGSDEDEDDSEGEEDEEDEEDDELQEAEEEEDEEWNAFCGTDDDEEDEQKGGDTNQ